MRGGTGEWTENNFRHIRLFSRKEVKAETIISVNHNFAVLSSWQSYSGYRYPIEGNYVYLVIYEFDNHWWEGLLGDFGVANNNRSVPIYAADGTPFMKKLEILSNQSPYIITPIKIINKDVVETSVNTSNFSLNNNAISFNTKHRN